MFFGLQQFERIERFTATSRVNISKNCKSLSVNARASGLSTLNVPDHFVVQNERHGQRTLGPFTPFEIERVGRRVFAEVTLARGGHKTGDAVVLNLGEQIASGRLGNDHHGQQRFELAGLGVEQANFDDIGGGQVFGELQDVLFE